MKLKYYLRGLGIGIIITTIILSIVSGKDSKSMSDEEVIARASEGCLVPIRRAQKPKSRRLHRPKKLGRRSKRLRHRRPKAKKLRAGSLRRK